MKVKIFTSFDENKLEKKINKFAEEHHIVKIHYRFSSNITASAHRFEQQTTYSVLVEYDDSYQRCITGSE